MDSNGITAVLLVLSLLIFVTMMVRLKHSYELRKLDRIVLHNVDRGLTTGELEDMIRNIVSETIAPLQDQVEELWRRLEQGDARLRDVDSPDDRIANQEETVGRNTRT